MTEQQFREQLKNAVDNTLSGLPQNSFLYQRVEAAASEGDNNLNKRIIPKTVIIMAAILLITLTTALASGLFGNVNWFGEVIPDQYQGQTLEPHTTPTPHPDDGPTVSLFDLTQEILLNRAEGELVIAQEEHSGSWMGMTKDIQSMAEFYAAMKNVEPLPLPATIPEGYEFVEGTIWYDCKPEGTYRLLSAETPAEGLTVKRYTVDEGMELIRCYDLLFRRNDDAHDYLSIYATLEYATDPLEHSFGLNPDQESLAVSVEGMDNALAIFSDSHTSLSMRRVLETPVAFLDFQPDDQHVIDTYAEVHVSIHARQLPVDALCSIFTAD